MRGVVCAWCGVCVCVYLLVIIYLQEFCNREAASSSDKNLKQIFSSSQVKGHQPQFILKSCIVISFLHVSRLLVGSKLQIHLSVPEVVVTIIK